MSGKSYFKRPLLMALATTVVVTSFLSTGCAVYTSGMTLPNPYYLKNRVQFFPAGPEAPFPKEVSQMQDMQADTLN